MQQLCNRVCQIAVRAGETILDVYNSPDDIKIESKSDLSPLTRADKAANQVIITALAQLKPHYPIISEENKEVPYEVRKDYQHYWLVDPLDGTKEFIKRNGEFTVNIALIHNGKPIIGVVYVPVKKELYYAIKGDGAYLKKDDLVIKLTASTYSLQDEGLRVVASRSHMNAETKEFVENLKSPEIVSTGSSLKFLILASGKADIYPRIAPTMEWDTGAAQIILEEAGGKVYQFGTDEPMVYNKPNLLNPHFIATARQN